MNLNTSCFVMQPEEMLPDGTPCKTGFCNKGVCEPTMTDIVIRIWDFFEDFKFSSVMRFLKVSTTDLGSLIGNFECGYFTV